MSFFGKLASGSWKVTKVAVSSPAKIGYGRSKKDGSHSHWWNKGQDRTPAQKAGDKARKKQK